MERRTEQEYHRGGTASLVGDRRRLSPAHLEVRIETSSVQVPTAQYKNEMLSRSSSPLPSTLTPKARCFRPSVLISARGDKCLCDESVISSYDTTKRDGPLGSSHGAATDAKTVSFPAPAVSQFAPQGGHDPKSHLPLAGSRLTLRGFRVGSLARESPLSPRTFSVCGVSSAFRTSDYWAAWTLCCT